MDGRKWRKSPSMCVYLFPWFDEMGIPLFFRFFRIRWVKEEKETRTWMKNQWRYYQCFVCFSSPGADVAAQERENTNSKNQKNWHPHKKHKYDINLSIGRQNTCVPFICTCQTRHCRCVGGVGDGINDQDTCSITGNAINVAIGCQNTPFPLCPFS